MYGTVGTRERLLRVPRFYGYLDKFQICEGVARGTITLAEACAAHSLSGDEFERWYAIYKRDGLNGFRHMNRNRRSNGRSTAA